MASILQADTILNAAGTGSPNFSQGLKLAGGSSSLLEYVAWTDFTPTYFANTGTITFTTELSKYSIIGKTMFLLIRAVSMAYSSGSGAVTLGITLPASKSHAISTAALTSLMGNDGGSAAVADITKFTLDSTLLTRVSFVKFDGSAWVANDQLNGIITIPIA